VHEIVAVAPDRLRRPDATTADGTHDLGTFDVLDSTVGPEHDVLTGLDIHTTRGATGEFRHHG